MIRLFMLILFVLIPEIQAAEIPDPVNPDPDSLRPMEAEDTVFIEDMTWIEVRDAMRAGKRTVIVATGGVEQNGPYLVTGKHNVVLRATTESIARRLGNALVAPIVPFVPEGDIDPPTQHMKYPGTISVSEETFQNLLKDICRSLKTHTFEHIVLIGDSGGNQQGMIKVAQDLSAEWKNSASNIFYVAEYYDFDSITKWLAEQGIEQMPEGLHDDFTMSSIMLSVDPKSVRMKQRIAAGNFKINGVDLSPAEKTIEWGKRIVEFRTDATVAAIRSKISAASKQARPTEAGLFVATPLTPVNEFTPGIEGPACDADGNIYAVNFASQSTIGRVTPDGLGTVFVNLPTGSVGNGIRFDTSGMMYVADYTRHNVLKINPKTRNITVFAHNGNMNQPNDLAIDGNGILFASDPGWADGTGQLWRIDPEGHVSRLQANMGTTNGIEVSPDNKTLYVNESVQRNVWAFSITDEGKLTNKRLIKKFPDYGFDGMRCDVDGNLYITRYGKGTVVKMTPMGDILKEIDVLGKRPSNICFGGPDGRTAYVTEVEHQRLVMFRVDRAGLSWSRRQ